jgi:Type II secretion system (T2SS), protein K/FG-GAP-like repeat
VVLINNGDGTFHLGSNNSTPPGTTHAILADFNGDNKPDIAVSNGFSSSVGIMIGHGDGTFEPEVNYPAGNVIPAIAAFDLNGDGHLDLVSTSYYDNEISILLGRGDGTFQPRYTIPVGGLTMYGVTAIDLGNGHPDLLVVTGDAHTISVMIGDGIGNFTTTNVIDTGSALHYVTAIDVNGDGFPDLVVAHRDIGQAAARAAADAGVQRVILNLIAYAPTAKANFRADGTVYAWHFANHTVRISVQDEFGKINLNQVPDNVLTGLIAATGVDRSRAQSLADAIADFRDPDNLRRFSGAEQTDYKAAGLTWGPKNAPFQEIEELQQVLGMTPEIYKRIAPYVSVHTTNWVNPSIADEQLTRILRQTGFSNFVDVQGMAYSIRAEAKSSSGAVFIRKAVVARNLLQSPSIQIVSWQEGR